MKSGDLYKGILSDNIAKILYVDEHGVYYEYLNNNNHNDRGHLNVAKFLVSFKEYVPETKVEHTYYMLILSQKKTKEVYQSVHRTEDSAIQYRTAVLNNGYYNCSEIEKITTTFTFKGEDDAISSD